MCFVSSSRRLLQSTAAAMLLVVASACLYAQQPADDTPDPALVNLAPTDPAASTQAPGNQAPGYQVSDQAQPTPGDYLQQAPAPIVRTPPGASQNQLAPIGPTANGAPGLSVGVQPGDPDYVPSTAELAGEQALDNADTTQAPEPPPALPDYDQPPDPEPNDLWTPGYWGYAPAGYFWVPGAWVAPPYYGALWTPPYWGFDGGFYRFHPGYWGLHVGYYGGINYGFGYIGIGYFGGYWRGRDFYYNRNVTNVNPVFVHTTYTRDVVYNNVHYGARPANRVSYNGGRGGIVAQPHPAELAALHEAHAPALAEQTQLHQQAAASHAQFFNANRGNPPQPTALVGRPSGRPIAPSPTPQQRQQPFANQQRSPEQRANPRPAPPAREQAAPRAEPRAEPRDKR